MEDKLPVCYDTELANEKNKEQKTLSIFSDAWKTVKVRL